MTHQTNKENNIAQRIRSRLAEEIGVEDEDIKDEDVFSDDLHMSPSEFSDFINNMGIEGIDASELDITNLSSVAELIEQVTTQLVD